MAIRDEIRHQQRKLKGKGIKAHVSYFLTYYLWASIGAVCAVAAVVVLVTTILGHKEQALEVMFLNATTIGVGSTDYGTALADGFTAYAGIDADRQEVIVDTSAYQTPGVVADTYDMSTSEKVSVHAAAGMLDCVVADASNFYYYAYSLAFEDLRDVLPEETIAQYEDVLYYVDLAEVNAYQEEVSSAESTDGLMTMEQGEAYEKVSHWVRPDPDTMADPIPVGVIVTDAPLIAESGVYTDRVAILGFVQNSVQHENAARFLEYLWRVS